MTKRTIIATAVSIFAAGGLITAAHAEGVKCGGTNACKGQGFTETTSAQACTSQGGKVL